MSEAGDQELSIRLLVVTEKSEIAACIFRFELLDPQRRELPMFTPGAHISVCTPSGVNRNYSLCNAPSERERYVIAVKREPSGRSGITPILSMMRHLKATGAATFKLYYCTRSPELTAFRQELSDAGWSSEVKIHHDFGDREKAFDFWPVFEKPANGTHIYCCGPRALMDSVKDMTGHWAQGSVHFESFGVDQALLAQNKPFKVRLERSGQTFEVPKDRSILEILRDHG